MSGYELTSWAAKDRGRWSDRCWRSLVFRQLSGLRHGTVVLADGDGERVFGDRDRDSDCRATVCVHRPAFYRRVAWGGELGAAESLLDGDWSCDDLTRLVRIFVRNLALTDRWTKGFGWMKTGMARLVHALRHNSRVGARRNITAHYDLGNDFYRLFLDETLCYSCGIFATPETTLREASEAKLDLICRKLDLQPGETLAEIGTGWGALALHAAGRYGARVTTTTISQQQFEVARQRVLDAGLSDRVTVLTRDYRDVTGQFDKLVSIEMVEAVGHEYLETFLRKCGELLRPEGTMLLQAIVIDDARHAEHLRCVDFMRRYIFPGGCLPCVSGLTQVAAEAAGLRLVHLEDFAAHYAQTLRCWRSRFHRQLPAVRRLGFDDRFVRMWDYYLAYCEAAFEERQVNVVQMLFAKRGYRRDPMLWKTLGSVAPEPTSTARVPPGDGGAGERSASGANPSGNLSFVP